MVTCLVCDHQKVVESFLGVECWHCGNSRKEFLEKHVDDYGRIKRLRCLVCDKCLHLPGQTSPRKTAGPEKLPCPSSIFGHFERQSAKIASGVGLCKTKIADLHHIKRGDHVAWPRWYSIWHHGIVVDVPDGGRELTVIHYNGGVSKLDGHFASVRLETIEVNPKKEEFYRIDYPAGDTYSVDEVVQRACDRLGEAKYNLVTNNCKHFAHWCKTGRAESEQVRKVADRAALACETSAAKTAQEVAADGIEALARGTIGTVGKIGLSDILKRTRRVFGTTSGVIHVPFLGGCVGSILGNLLERWLGAVIGKKIAAILR